jgi:hypothetical protein
MKYEKPAIAFVFLSIGWTAATVWPVLEAFESGADCRPTEMCAPPPPPMYDEPAPVPAPDLCTYRSRINGLYFPAVALCFASTRPDDTLVTPHGETPSAAR